MRFAPVDLHLDCAELVRGNEQARRRAVQSLAARAVRLVHRSGFVVFRLGRLRLGAGGSRALAHAVCEALREALVGGGAPSEMRIEYDRAQETQRIPATD